MIDRVLQSIGVRSEIIESLGQAELHWARPALFWVGLVLMIPAGYLIVRRHNRNLSHISPTLRKLLSACRIGVLLVLVFILGGPYLRLDRTFTQKPVLAVVVDESESMTLPAGPFTDQELPRIAVASGVAPPPSLKAETPSAGTAGTTGGAPQAPKPAPPPQTPPAAGAAPSPAGTPPVSELDAAIAKMTVTPEMRKKVNEMTRLQIADAALVRQRDTLLKSLAERFDIKGYRVARGVRTTVVGEPPKASLQPGELDETDLGAALDRCVDDARGRNLAGVVLISDGRWTTGNEPSTVLQRMAAAASNKPDSAGEAKSGEKKTDDAGTGTTGGAAEAANGGAPKPTTEKSSPATPIFAVPVGSNQPPIDVSIVDLLAPAHVAKGDVVSVMASVDSQGLDGRKVDIKLLGNEGKVIDTKPITLSGAERQQVLLTFNATDPGSTILSAVVDDQKEEQVKQNNKQSTLIEVDTERTKVLILEGIPRWDFRFLDHSLRRDNGIEAMVVMESQLLARGIAPEDLPKAAKLPEDAAGFKEFAAVYIGDISPSLLPPRLQEQLAKAVEEEGLGLIVQAGSQSMPRDFAGGPLARLLPVRIDTRVADSETVMLVGVSKSGPVTRRVTGIEAPAFAPFRMTVTATGAIHPAFRLYDNATQSRGVWSRMPEFYWASAVLDAGQAATVLAKIETPGPAQHRPLIAECYAGRGRVLYLGLDSTYRWRKNIGTHLFYRYWGQALRHVAKAKDKSKDRSWLEAFPTRVEPREPVTIELYAVDREGQPITSNEMFLQVTGAENGDRVRLDKTPQPGIYRGQWAPANQGQYKLNFTDMNAKTVSTAIQVAGSGRELRRPVVDREFLGNLADASGGRLLEIDQLAKLGDMVRGQPLKITQTHESEIWDNWITLLLVALLYFIDLTIRRITGLQ